MQGAHGIWGSQCCWLSYSLRSLDLVPYEGLSFGIGFMFGIHLLGVGLVQMVQFSPKTEHRTELGGSVRFGFFFGV